MVAKSGGMGDFFMDKFWGTEKGRKYGIFFAVVAGIYFFMKYLSPVLSPFLLAFLIAGVLIPLFTFLDIALNKHRGNFGADNKTKWFYQDDKYDRKFDERADRNEYKF